MSKPTVFFITGVNGAGKSTIVPILKKLLPRGYRIHDFDERGVPNNVDRAWRFKTTKHWLAVAHHNAGKQITTIICGLTLPSEIHSAIRKVKKLPVRIGLLDVSAGMISARLHRRFSTPAKIRNLKAVTKLSVAECIATNIQRAKLLRRECKKYRCQFFITSRTTPKKTAIRVAEWILD